MIKWGGGSKKSCFWGHMYHEWEIDKCDTYEIRKVISKLTISRIDVIIQKRKCYRCGFTQFNKQEIVVNAN